MRGTNKFYLFFRFFFETLFTVSFTMAIKLSHVGESAGGWWSTSKFTCVVPAWTLTSGSAFFWGLCKPVIAPTDLWPQETPCKWSLACLDLSKSSFGAIQEGDFVCHGRPGGGGGGGFIHTCLLSRLFFTPSLPVYTSLIIIGHFDVSYKFLHQFNLATSKMIVLP